MNDTVQPIYRFDPQSRISWLEFDGKPDQAIIDLLKKDGWRWSGYRKQWHTNRRFAKPPVGIEYEDGGECDYASERPDRLKNAAERAETRSEEAYERSNALVDGIPYGQPILVGHHSQRRHEKTLERSRSAMDKSVEEAKKAEHLEYKAKSSARYQAYKERPDVIYRRIKRLKRLKGEITSIKNQHHHEVLYQSYGLKDAPEEKKQAIIAQLKAAKQSANERIALIEAEITENEAALAAAGGLAADSLDVQIGDVIKGGWRGLCQIQKINTRNGVLMSYTCTPLENTWHSKYVIPKDEVYGVAVRKDDVSSEAILQAKGEAGRRTYTPPEPKEERTFAVEQVQTMEVYDNRTSLFPTPQAQAEQLVQEIPSDASLILEPSAGTGSIADAATHLLFERGQNHGIHCCEILPQLRRNLAKRGYQVVGEDFLEYQPDFLYDCIIANPPFKNTEWMDHVEHMFALLKPGGTLAVIVPAGFTFRDDKRIKQFRELVEEHGNWWELPEDTFVASGTAVRTVMLRVVKPGSSN